MQLSWPIPTPPKKRVHRTAKGYPAQLDKHGNPMGRPRKYAPGTERHVTRPQLPARIPVHVTMRLVDDVRNARKRDIYKALWWAMMKSFELKKARICQLSIQRTHLHAIVEADDHVLLSRGMQGFQISAARLINRVLRRTGRVFADRFHAEYLTTPTQTRQALLYVLNNFRKHGEDRFGRFSRFRVDPFSSAPMFGGFSDYNSDGRYHFTRWPATYARLQIWLPKTWLLRTGWLERGGGPFSVWDIPGPRSPRRRATTSR